LSSSI
jgi:hypothetical protein